MLTAGVAFGAALVTSAVLTPIVRKLAHVVGAIDQSISSRKVHTAPIPRLGGLAIVVAFFAPLIGLYFVKSSVASRFIAQPHGALAIFGGGTAIAALGVYDDIRGSNARQKFVVQFAVAGGAYALGFRIEQIANPFGNPLALGSLALPFTLLFIVGIVNAINLIDGLDGLAGGVSIICVLTSLVVAVVRGDVLMMLTTAALAGAILGFLFYNFNPASIFMGDTGSLFLGYILAISSIQSHQKSEAVVSILVPLIAMGIPVTDTLLAIARRAARGLPLFRGDREHIHHRLLARGLSHRAVVMVIYAATVVLGTLALAISLLRGVAPQVAAVTAALGSVLLLRRLGYLQIEKARSLLEMRRRNLDLWRTMRQVNDELRVAKCVEDVWRSLHRAMSVLDATWARLELVATQDGERKTFKLSDGTQRPADLVSSRHGLRSERLESGYLELCWRCPDAALRREAELAVDILCTEMLTALERVVDPTTRSSIIIDLTKRLSAEANAMRDRAPSDWPVDEAM